MASSASAPKEWPPMRRSSLTMPPHSAKLDSKGAESSEWAFMKSSRIVSVSLTALRCRSSLLLLSLRMTARAGASCPSPRRTCRQ
eukprot:5235968-Prymnesium_polylepis.2